MSRALRRWCCSVCACGGAKGVDDAGTGGGSTSLGGGTAAGGGASTGGGGGSATGGGASVGGGNENDAGPVDGGGVGGGMAPVTPQWVLPAAGLTANQLAVLVNTNDLLSVQVADRYMSVAAHSAREPRRPHVSHRCRDGASLISRRRRRPSTRRLDGGIQALALTWTNPYRVDCMSVTTAFAAGYDAGAFCSTPCNATLALPTYDSTSHTPYTDFGILPTMMIAANDAGNAYALIDRGVAADGTLPLGEGYFVPHHRHRAQRSLA